MYVPAHFDASDLGFCHGLIRAYPFAPIITGASASHVPFLLDPDRGPYGTVVGHLARPNQQHDVLAQGAPALVVFTGPHAYVSPTWYETHPAVPTWNYCVVHVHGIARILDDDATRVYLARLVAQFDPNWRFDALPDDYRTKMVRGIVAFDLEILRIEGKAKLSQNRSPADIANVIAALESSSAPGDAEVGRWMRRARVDGGTPSDR